MNRLRIMLIISALVMGSSALASAEEFHHDGRFDRDDRGGNRDRDRDRDYRDRDHDRDDGYRRVVVYPDHRWVDASGRLCYDPAYWRFDLGLNLWVRR